MKTNLNSTESNTDSKKTSEQTTPENENQETDDLGYEKVPSEEVVPPKKEESEEPAKKKEETAEVKKPAGVTGYGDKEEETPVEEKKKEEEKKPEDLSEEEKAQKEIDDAVKALGDNYDQEKVKKFAIENKLSKAQVEAYVNFAKEEDKQAAKAREEVIKTQRKAWNKELLEDKEFGGSQENFDKSLLSVENLLENHLPNVKKQLTEKGGVLPPYIMRDFLGLAKALNPVAKFIPGEEPKPKEESGNFLDDMYL